MAVIFISHDLNVIRKIADRVLVMKSGRIIEQGKCEDIFNHPKERYTKSLIYASNVSKEPNNNQNDFVLQAHRLVVKYPLKKSFWGKVREYLYAVNNISVKLKAGKTLGIVGESGSGKTTLGMAIAGLNKFEGDIFYKGQDIKLIKNKELRKKIQIVFQDPYNSLNPRMTVGDIVGEGLLVHFKNLSKNDRINKVVNVLHEVGLKEDILNKYPHEFSGGQRQRIAIARALVVEPEVLILDEPTSALDVTIAAQILKLLQKIQKDRGLAYLFITHDMKAIKAMADDIAVLKDGKIVELNAAGKIFNQPRHPYTKNLIYSANLKKQFIYKRR